MELNELQNRLTNIITGISNLGPRIIQGITQGFIKYYIPDQIWVISITDIEGIEQTAIEYYTWDEEKVSNFSRISIYTLNENFANTNLINPRPNLGTWVFTYANLVSHYRLS